MSSVNKIPVIDLFAGPGGLGEGFESFESEGHKAFQVKLSIEKDRVAHRTLLLRSFYRQFEHPQVPDEYYQYLRGEITRETLFETFPEQYDAASLTAWQAELGLTPHSVVKDRIQNAIGESKMWVLLGGPPCQAYSVVGRVVMKGQDPKKYELDKRHFLYREYVQIIAEHKPPVFVMENVKGMLSSTADGKRVFDLILADLENPVGAVGSYGLKSNTHEETVNYDIFPLNGTPVSSLTGIRPNEFVLKCEDLGLPQKRHRVFLVGVRRDLGVIPGAIQRISPATTTRQAIADLPPLRSGISRATDSEQHWKAALRQVRNSDWFASASKSIRNEITIALKSIESQSLGRGAEFVANPNGLKCNWFREWYCDERLGGELNHSTRSHIVEDLYRYLYAACFAKVTLKSPHLKDFPEALLPNHQNAADGVEGKTFSDRFHVQPYDSPSTTVISHISKDGHYFIHPDPTQCRSMTVREVARLQTFPDNYFFEGGRTGQYQQVGNAVPPLLAREIGAVIHNLLRKGTRSTETD